MNSKNYYSESLTSLQNVQSLVEGESLRSGEVYLQAAKQFLIELERKPEQVPVRKVTFTTSIMNLYRNNNHFIYLRCLIGL